ncbi:MAG: type II toxin-antitoxin system HicB family antitoxin [Candidatus Aminicenantes bacterium]|nr:type II toxin-antitoxin system HicB family antitoxin [Candidatus Aminicenantes bacterium]
MKANDRYLKLVEWSDEDQCYIGSVPGWIGKCCHGDDEIEVYEALCEIVQEWIKIYHQDERPLPPPTNKQYSGKFVLRTGPELHRVLAVKALNEGESINRFVIRVLRKNLQMDIS